VTCAKPRFLARIPVGSSLFDHAGAEFAAWTGMGLPEAGVRRIAMKTLRTRVGNRDGQGLTEYLVLLLLIAVVSIAAVKSLGGTIKTKLQEARNHINSDAVLE
jgi:Flp pilus assembly pilin Flp